MENKWLKLRYDYWLHLLAGYSIIFTLLLFVDPGIALLATIYIGWIKEWYNEHLRPSEADIFDLIWTIIGGFVAYGVWELAKHF